MSEVFRCKLSDHIIQDQLCRWPDGDITWTIIQELSSVPFEQFHHDLEWGINQWVKACKIRSIYVERAWKARVLIGSRRIDGPGGIIAQTELPCGVPQVRMWFDVGERWTSEMTPQERAVILPDVSWHEWGHALGIGHAPRGTRNIMAPVYDPNITEPGGWDLAESTMRYGVLVPPVPPPPLPPVPPKGDGKMESRESLRERIKVFLSVAEFFAKRTSNTADDKVVQFGYELVSQDWLLDLVLLLMQKVGKDQASLTVEDLANTLHEFQRVA